jgi:hypothetical protein
LSLGESDVDLTAQPAMPPQRRSIEPRRVFLSEQARLKRLTQTDVF